MKFGQTNDFAPPSTRIPADFNYLFQVPMEQEYNARFIPTLLDKHISRSDGVKSNGQIRPHLTKNFNAGATDF